MTGPAWVVGGGGLLGSHVRRAFLQHGRELRPWDCPVGPFDWKDGRRLFEQVDASVDLFVDRIRAEGRPWSVLWCAGVGIVGADPSVLEVERIAFERLLDRLDRIRSSAGSGVPGVVFLASSGGAIYGDCPDQPITEASEPRPISPYGRHKLAMEGLLLAWAAGHPSITPLVGRISNLYGVGQNASKPQGLISHMSRSIILNSTLNIYMSLDTMRDYLHARDCAGAVADLVDHLVRTAGSCGATPGAIKILASERTASIAQILGIFASLTRYRPRYLCHSSPSATLQPRCLRFRSDVLRDVTTARLINLPFGIKLVHQQNVSDFLRGRLRPSLARLPGQQVFR